MVLIMMMIPLYISDNGDHDKDFSSSSMGVLTTATVMVIMPAVIMLLFGFYPGRGRNANFTSHRSLFGSLPRLGVSHSNKRVNAGSSCATVRPIERFS